MMKTISRKEAATARSTLASIEKRYAEGQMSRGLYIAQREKLHDLLKMPVAEDTKVKTNTRRWFARNYINNSAAPVGYFGFEQNQKDSLPVPNTVGNNMNKIRQGMLSLTENEYWNSGDIQLQLKNQAKTVINQNQATNSYYNQAIKHANNLNAGLGLTAGATTDQIVANLQASSEVQAALQALSTSISTLIRERVSNGASPANARNELISLAIESGAKLTQLGYDAEAAGDIVSKLVKGEITEMRAIYEMASDLREANKILNSLGSRPNSTIRPSSGLLDQIYATPSGGRGGYIPSNYNVHNMRPRMSALNMPYGTLNLPTLRAMAQQASEQGNEQQLLQIEQAISLRQEAMQSVRRGGRTNQQGQPSNGISPEFQSRALNFSPVVNQAIRRQKPDMATVLNDVFTIDGNLYFNPQAGNQIIIGNDLREATANNDPNLIRPSGQFTIWARASSGLENLGIIRQSLLYTMASPAWDEYDKMYLEYLLGTIDQQITTLSQNQESVAQTSSPVQQMIQQSYQNSPIQQQSGQNNTLQNMLNQQVNQQVNQQMNQQMNQKQNNYPNNIQDQIRQNSQQANQNNSVSNKPVISNGGMSPGGVFTRRGGRSIFMG